MSHAHTQKWLYNKKLIYPCGRYCLGIDLLSFRAVMFKVFLLILSFTASLPGDTLHNNVLNDASKAQKWLKPLHFSSGSNAVKLKITIFLAINRHVNPRAELQATINALFSHIINNNPKTHVIGDN